MAQTRPRDAKRGEAAFGSPRRVCLAPAGAGIDGSSRGRSRRAVGIALADPRGGNHPPNDLLIEETRPRSGSVQQDDQEESIRTKIEEKGL